jgi:hypothetical protein
MGFTISDLRERPEFFPVVADRVWDFTWKAKGLALEQVSVGLGELISSQAFPFVIVAHDGERYLGSTLGVVSDLDEARNTRRGLQRFGLNPRTGDKTSEDRWSRTQQNVCFKHSSAFTCAHVRQGTTSMRDRGGCRSSMKSEKSG